MTDNDRNSRTLIVCFVVAIMALVPLRFVEIGQMGLTTVGQESASVLGETTQNEVVLPETNLIEAPYNEETVTECLSTEEADAMLTEIVGEMNRPGTSVEQQESLSQEIQDVIGKQCQ